MRLVVGILTLSVVALSQQATGRQVIAPALPMEPAVVEVPAANEKPGPAALRRPVPAQPPIANPNANATVEAAANVGVDPNADYALFPAGVVDKEWKKAYVLGSGGTLDAIDLTTGKLLWRSAVQALPLAIVGDRVYALSPTTQGIPAFHVVGLSIKGEGKLASKSDAITVDEWVAGEFAGKNVTAQAKIEKGKMQLSWTASGMVAQNAGGVFRGRARIPRTVQNMTATGSVTIDLEKGTVEEAKQAAPVAAASEASHDGKQYRVTSDAESGKSTLECRDAKGKTLWQVEVLATGTPASNGTGTGVGQPVPIRPLGGPMIQRGGVEVVVPLPAN